MKKSIISGFMFCLLFPLFSSRVLAVSEFESNYLTTYQIEASGETLVLHEVGLKNKLSNVYADSFSLSVGLTDLSSVRVRDSLGLIEPEVEATQNQTTISFQFIDKVVGKDKVNNFSVAYVTSDVANKNGLVWEINIPELETSKTVVSQDVKLLVPSIFGAPAYITPIPDERVITPNSQKGYSSFVFKNVTEPISAVFGKEQVMAFELSFFLENESPVKVEKVIAIPPDTNYQSVVYDSITPKPKVVEIDESGNYLASFDVSPNQVLEILAKGKVKLKFDPEISIANEEVLADFVKPSQYWPIDDPMVKKLASDLKTPKTIYDYVIDFLAYDYGQIEAGAERKGVIGVIGNPQASICADFTDLFVTLTRAAGIPSRELQGFAFTSNDKLRPLSLTRDVLHAWPEYFDRSRNMWIQVDPTWADTTGGIDYFNKLDLNHFVFVIHGTDPISPLPAGAYKAKGQSTKAVKVTASDLYSNLTPVLEFTVNNSGGLFRPVAEVEINNQSGVRFEKEMRFETGGSQESVKLIIPPFGTSKVKINQSNWLKGDKITVEYGTERKTIATKKNNTIVMAATVGGFLVAVTFIAISLYLRRRR